MRAAGADHSWKKLLLGKFPLGLPDLKSTAAGGPWEMESISAGGEPSSRTFSLQPRSGRPAYKAQPEGSLGAAGAPTNYFVLLRQRGSDEFVALPVQEWYTFKPETQRMALT